MKFGKWSSAILLLFVLGFFVVNYILPAFAGVGPGVAGRPSVWANISASGFFSGDKNQTDEFFTCNNVMYINANVSCSDGPCNETLVATANFSAIGGGWKQGVNVSGLDGESTRLFEFNGTVDCTQVTITNFQMANITVNASNDGTAGAVGNVGWTGEILVNMSTIQSCPPEGQGQLPPQVPLLNGTFVPIAFCFTNCTGDDHAQVYNSTHYVACGPNFGGDSVNFTAVSYNGNFSAVPLVLDILGKVKINFTTPVNMSDQQKSAAIMEFAMKNMMAGGRVGVNDTEWNGQGGKPDMRVTAKITIYNVSGRLGISPPHMPIISRRSTYGSGDFNACGIFCGNTSWDGENLTFDVSSFSEYDITQGLSIVLSTPANNAHITNSSLVSGAPFRNINFTFTPKWNDTVFPRNATLFGNFTGTWAVNISNSTPLVNASLNGINLTVPNDGAYIWNIVLYDNSTPPGFSDSNTANFTVMVDTVNPSMNATTPANASYIYGKSNTQFFEVYAYDRNMNYSNVTVHFNINGAAWNNTALTCRNLTTANISFECNKSIDLGPTVAMEGDVIRFYFDGSDDSTNYVSNGTAAAYWITTLDKTAPKYSGAATNVSSGSAYTPAKGYSFQITWTDTGGSGVGTVNFEHNFSSGSDTMANKTATSCGSNLYCANFTQEEFKAANLGYGYKWYAGDSVTPSTDANWNVTSYSSYSFSLADNPVNMYLNDTLNSGISLTYGATVNATGVATGGSVVLLYRNVSGAITDVDTDERSQNITLPAGAHLYLINTSGNANYTTNATGINYTATVNKAATTITYYINSTSSSSNTNITVASGTAVNITTSASNTQGWIKLYRDGVLEHTSDQGAVLENVSVYTGIPGAEWNITTIYNGSENYSASSGTWNYVKIEALPPTHRDVTVNITNGTVVGKYNGTLNITANWSDTYKLDKYWLYSNLTGTWQVTNVTDFVDLATGNWSNITINLADITLGYTFWTIVYANDTSNNTNNTDTYQWTIDNTAPTLNNTTPVNGSHIYGTSSQLFQVYVYDDTLNTSNVTLHWGITSTPEAWTNKALNCYNITSASISFICNTTVDLSGQPNLRIISYYFDASDQSRLYGNNGTAGSPWSVTIDRVSPQYSSNATNATLIGRYDGIQIAATWTNGGALDSAILELNFSGVKWNQSEIRMSGTSYTARFNYSNSTYWTPGSVIYWRMYANDTVPNWNATEIGSSFTIDSTAPKWSDEYTNTTNDTQIAKGASINVSAKWDEDFMIDKYWLWSNMTSGVNGKNYTVQSFASGNLTNVTLDSNTTIPTGAIVHAKIYANDSSGNENVTETWQWTIDNTVPIGTANDANTTNASIIAKGASILVTGNWTDNVGLSYYWVGHNETGTWYNTTPAVFAATSNSNSTAIINTSTATVGKTLQIIMYANDTSGNENTSETFQYTIDNTVPAIGNSTVSPSSPVEYSPGRSYLFNASVADNLANSVIFFEWNGSSNYSASAVTGATNNYSYTLTDLAVSLGNYTFRWIANDTSGNEAASAVETFNVTQNTTNPAKLYLNGTEGDLIVTYLGATNATGAAVYPNSGTVNLYRNNELLGTSYDVGILGNNTYTYIANTSGTVNYTSNSSGISYVLYVHKGTSNISLWIGNTTGALEQNVSIDKAVTANFTAIINTSYTVGFNMSVNISGWGQMNSSSNRIANTTSTSNVDVGLYNVTAWFDEDANFTADSQTWWLTITQDLTPPVVLVNYTLDFENGTYARSGAGITANISVTDVGVGIAAGATCNVTIGGTVTTNLTYSSGWCNGTVTIPSGSDGNNTFNVTISDSNGNVGKNDTLTVSIDNTPPIINVSTPLNASYMKVGGGNRVWINGTVYDNLALYGNVTANYSNFTTYSFTGVNYTNYAIYNNSLVADGYILLIINVTDKAGNIGNVTVYFYEDNIAPSAAYGLTNSSSQYYAPSASQDMQVIVVDAQQTNATVTLNYHLNGTWFTAILTGTPNTSTLYSGTISTISNTTLYDAITGKGYMPYYITGVDNATNSIANGGGVNNPLGNLTFGTTGTVQGYIVKNGTITGISGATVSDGTRAAVTNTNGFYQITGVPAGDYTLTASATNYTTNTTSATVTAGATTNANITMAYTATGVIQGYVKVNGTTTVLVGATVSDGTRAAMTNNDGFYQISNVPAGTYTVTANATNYVGNSSSATVTAGTTTNLNISLTNNATGVIQGYVYLTNTSIVPNYTVQVSDGNRTAVTNTNGFYQITGVPAGDYILTVSGSGDGYWTNSTSVIVPAGATTTQNMRVIGAESYNITVPGPSTSSSRGFLELGWNGFWFYTGGYSAATTNYTVEYLMLSIGKAGNYNYTAVWRYNATNQTWASFIPQATGNTLINVSSSADQYWVYVNSTDRVELEPRYTSIPV